jgi:hypothetical protein
MEAAVIALLTLIALQLYFIGRDINAIMQSMYRQEGREVTK